MEISKSLYETVSAILLREFDETITWNKLGAKLFQVWNSFEGNEPVESTAKSITMETITRADPTQNKKYSLWIATRISNKDPELVQLLDEKKSASMIRIVNEVLKQFDTLKTNRKISGHAADINQYKTFGELAEKINSIPQEDIVSNKSKKRNIAKEMQKQAELFLSTPEYTVIVPLTQEASCYYGQNTKWCTASTQADNAYHSYAKNGQKLFIIIPKAPTHTGEKYQVHFQSGTFMDEQDDEVEIGDLMKKFPEFFKKASDTGELSDSEFVLFMTTEAKEKMISSLAVHMDDFVRSIGEEAEEDDQDYSQYLADNYADEDGDVDWERAYEDFPYSEFNPEFKLWLDNVEGYKFRSVEELNAYLLQFNELENPAVLLYVGEFFAWVINEKSIENNDETWFTDELMKRVKPLSVRGEDGYLY